MVLEKDCVLYKRVIPLLDSTGHNISYEITVKINELIGNIDEARVEKIFGIISEHERVSYINEIAFREAFFSARLGGDHIFEADAREALRTGKGIDTGRLVLINNYNTLKNIYADYDREINDTVTLLLYRLLYRNLVDESILNGYKLRSTCVWDVRHNSIAFVESDAEGEMKRINEFTGYFNGCEINPLIKSCILYYYFLENGPFYKGNDRIGRMLLNEFLLKNHYKFIKCFSISKLLYESRNKFNEIFESCREKHCITKFIEAMLELYYRGSKIIYERYKNSFGMEIVDRVLRSNGEGLSKYQHRTLNKIASGKINAISISEYQELAKLSYRGARQELEHMVLLGYFKRIKDGKKFIYILNDIEKIGDITIS